MTVQPAVTSPTVGNYPCAETRYRHCCTLGGVHCTLCGGVLDVVQFTVCTYAFGCCEQPAEPIGNSIAREKTGVQVGYVV